MFLVFESMWDAHPGRINFARHGIGSSLADAKVTRSVPCRADPNACGFDKKK